MLDNDKLTYTQPKHGIDADSRRLSERVLLTQDRAQKLDLLIHLLTNLNQSLVVCGPAGIGKTTLLKTLQTGQQDVWPICLLQGSSTLSFESVIGQLNRFLSLPGSGADFDMSALRRFCDKHKVVLIIDDADQLLPGLMRELMDLADSLSGLRLVFSMNYDEYKQQSDVEPTFDGCHFIELPPLTQRQCLTYLQNLSAQPDALLSFNAITDGLVEELYLETQGIPGKLLAELPKLGQYQSRQSRKLGLLLGVTVMLIAAGFIAKSLLPTTTPEQMVAEEKTPTPVEPAPPDTPQAIIEPETTILEAPPAQDISPAIETETSDMIGGESRLEEAETMAAEVIPNSPGSEENTNIPSETDQAVEQPKAAAPAAAEHIEAKTVAPVAEPAAPKAQAVKKPQAPKAASVIEPKPADISPAKAMADNGDLSWIMAQPADNYTIQLMVLSSKDSVTRFLKKHAEYRDRLKYFRIGQSGQEKYVLIFGSFQSASDALESRYNMPDAFNDGIVKRFKAIQKQSRH